MKTRLIILSIASLSLLFGGWIGAAHFPQVQDEEQSEQIESASRKEFMRGKLLSNQKVVEGLSLKDFGLVREGDKALPRWSKVSIGLCWTRPSTRHTRSRWKMLPTGSFARQTRKTSMPPYFAILT